MHRFQSSRHALAERRGAAATVSAAPPARLFGIPATRAPIVAVLRRGPSAWSHVGRWDVGRGRYEPGAWIRANLYPQRCDLSPDGRWLCYFTLKMPGRWKAGATYVALSRLPWLTALAAWATHGTWTRGAHFVDDPRVWEVGEPDEGDASPCRGKFGLAVTRPATFAVERRRGWTETAGTPPRNERDVWDERRGSSVVMEKPRPRFAGYLRLRVRGSFAAFRDTQAKDIAYELFDGKQVTPLAEARRGAMGRLGRRGTTARCHARRPAAGPCAVESRDARALRGRRGRGGAAPGGATAGGASLVS